MTGPTPAPTGPPKPYALDDPTVLRFSKFLERTPLSSGQFAPIPPPMSQYLAQAVCNYTQGLVWDADRKKYAALGEWEKDPEFGDLLIESVSEGGVTRMTQRSTGISVLGESTDDAWRALRAKVRSST